MVNKILFCSEKDPCTGYLSNMYNTSSHIVINDEKWLSVEHYIQAMKFRGPDASPESLDYSIIINKVDTDMKYMILGTQIEGRSLEEKNLVVNNRTCNMNINDIVTKYKHLSVRSDWDTAIIAVAVNALVHKFTQFPELAKKLASVPEDTYFVYDNKSDRFLGDRGGGVTGNCKNYLGKILTALSFILKHGSCDNISSELSELVRIIDTDETRNTNKGMVKILSWNVNGIRSKVLSILDFKKCKSFTSIDPESNLGLVVTEHDPDILCFQETKCDEPVWNRIVINGYHQYWSASKGAKARAGNRYSGVSVWTKIKPNRVSNTLPTLPIPDEEGRVLVLEFDNFVLINTYSPNSGTNRDYRINVWDKAVREYLRDLKRSGVKVIWAGDLNVSHTENDVFFSKPGYNPHKIIAGYTPEERENFSSILTEGYTDSLRYLYPKSDNIYTWWNPKNPSDRLRNLGMRLDYFVVSNELTSCIQNSEVLYDSGTSTSPHASDHAAILLTIKKPGL